MKTNKTHIFVLLILAAVTFIANNAALPADYMESRNLATAQEMVATGEYLIPTMNGELRLEKPPLPTWIAAAIEHITPGNLAAQRTATALSGILLMFFVYAIVDKLTQRKQQAFMSAAILATSYAVIMMSRNATWDIYCHTFMLGGILYFIKGIQEKNKVYLNFIITGLFWSLSFLAKGPVSFFALLLPFLIAYFGYYRPSMRGKWIPLLVSVLITVVISGAWPLYVYIHEQDHLSYVAQKESGSWGDHNVRPWYYYKLFFVESGIWSLFWITSLLYAFFKRDFKKDSSSRFFLFWTLAVLILLSIVPEKKTRYLLPILIPGAMNMGAYWYYIMTNHIKKTKDKLWFNINVGLLTIIFIAIPPTIYFLVYKENLISLTLLIILAICFWAFAAFLINAMTRQEPKKQNIFTTILIAMAVVTSIAFIPAKKIFVNTDRHSIRELRGIKKWDSYPFFHPETEFLRMELVYESNRIIRPMDFTDKNVINQKVPFILVSTQPVEQLMPVDNYKITPIGKYDNNWRQTDSKRYNTELVKEVYLIEAK